MFSEEDKKRFWKDVHLLKHIRPGMLTRCWVRGRNASYAQFMVNGKSIGAHIYSWLLYGGQQPPQGFLLHHRCGKKQCVNPTHLVVTLESGHGEIHGVETKTFCKHCHQPFNEDNPTINAAGHRICGGCPPPPASCNTPVQVAYLAKVGKLANVYGGFEIAKKLGRKTSISNWLESHRPIPSEYLARIDELYDQLP